MSAQQHAPAFKVPKPTHRLRAASQGFTGWLPTSATLGKVLGVSEAKVSLVVFYSTVLPNVLLSVSIRITICPVNTILVSLVARTIFGKASKKTDPAAKSTNYFCILSSL